MCIRTNLRHASRQEPTFGPAVGTWWGATVSGFNIWRVEWGTYTHHHSFIRPYLQDIHGGGSHSKVVPVTWRSQYEKSKTGGEQSSSRFSRSLIQWFVVWLYRAGVGLGSHVCGGGQRANAKFKSRSSFVVLVLKTAAHLGVFSDNTTHRL